MKYTIREPHNPSPCVHHLRLVSYVVFLPNNRCPDYCVVAIILPVLTLVAYLLYKGFSHRNDKTGDPHIELPVIIDAGRGTAIEAKQFVPANCFKGERNGYSFKTGVHGLGYYHFNRTVQMI